MFLTFSRIVKTSFQHIKRNFKLSIASTLIMTLTFFVSTIFAISLYGAGIVLNYFENQSQIIVFFNPDNVTDTDITAVTNAVKGLNISSDITYVSKKDAYQKFVAFLKQESPGLSQSVNVDKLPPSLEIRTTNIDNLEHIANTLYAIQNQNTNHIDKILYYKNVEDFLKQFILVVRYTALAFISFLVGISLLIIWITIGIALNVHSDEIEIMQLVGATRSYIEFPYILEGALYGIAGSFLALVSILIGYILFAKFGSSTYISFLSFFKGIPLPAITLQEVLLGVIIEMVIGSFVGAIGSFVAVRSKLK